MSEQLTQPGNVEHRSGNLRHQLIALVAFGVSFGFVEAAVVEYLRFVWQPIHARYFPDSAADSLFPLFTLDQLRSEGPEHVRILITELVREAATLVMLAAAGLAVARNARQWLAGFMIAFGVWDIFFYAFLKVLLDWPESIFTWDLLFLLPVPWTGPVIAPLLVSLSMIGAGVVIFWRESAIDPIRLGLWNWVCILLGGLLVIAAFCWDYRNIMVGGLPQPFNWPLFVLGESVGLAGFVLAVRPVRWRALAFDAAAW